MSGPRSLDEILGESAATPRAKRPSLEMQAQIGQRAQQLLRDPLLVSAFEQIEARFTNDWRQSTLGQSDLREEVYRMLCALDEVRAHLTKLVRDGQYAAYTLEQRAERGR